MVRTTPHERPLTTAEPLYWRIATQLLGELRDGTIPPGERLPGERQLAGHFGVSRETVRQALEVLRSSGLVATDRRGSHAVLPGAPVADPAWLAFPVGSQLSAVRSTATGRRARTDAPCVPP